MICITFVYGYENKSLFAVRWRYFIINVRRVSCAIVLHFYFSWHCTFLPCLINKISKLQQRITLLLRFHLFDSDCILYVYYYSNYYNFTSPIVIVFILVICILKAWPSTITSNDYPCIKKIDQSTITSYYPEWNNMVLFCLTNCTNFSQSSHDMCTYATDVSK